MTRSKGSPVPLTRVYRELIERIPGPGRLKEGLALYFWPRVAGKELETKAKAERVKNGILWVKCPDPAFSYNLSFFKKEIMRKYRRLLGPGVIRSVRIVTGEVENQPQATEENYPYRVAGPLGKLTFPPEVKRVSDAGLRAAYTRFYNLCKKVKEGPGKA